MPLPVAGIIAAGTQLASAGINAASTANLNRKNRKFARESWELQNEYNHPSAQMARLREAGLNPNLVYGKGADNTAQAISTPKTEAPRFDLDATPVLAAHYDTKMKQAQIDNLRVQNTVLEQDKALKAAQIVATLATAGKTDIDTKTGTFDLDMKQTLKETSMEMMQQQLRKLQADTDYTMDQNERASAMQAPTLQLAVEKILTERMSRANTAEQTRNLKQQLENLKSDNTIKQLDIELKKLGIQPSDALWQRVLGRIIGDPKKITDKIKPLTQEQTNSIKEELRKKFLNK